mmetsp:Transcript_41336/g.108608  ORF Transcript_41336/g.108608 Transcript_41336/m.108608 type:complete len:234 (+) Transcript_41336:1170-1871(+)
MVQHLTPALEEDHQIRGLAHAVGGAGDAGGARGGDGGGEPVFDGLHLGETQLGGAGAELRGASPPSQDLIPLPPRRSRLPRLLRLLVPFLRQERSLRRHGRMAVHRAGHLLRRPQELRGGQLHGRRRLPAPPAWGRKQGLALRGWAAVGLGSTHGVAVDDGLGLLHGGAQGGEGGGLHAQVPDLEGLGGVGPPPHGGAHGTHLNNVGSRPQSQQAARHVVLHNILISLLPPFF